MLETLSSIMLVCSAGMSTSMLAERMLEAAKAAGMAHRIRACSEVEAKRHFDDTDVILLGPQVRYLRGRIEKALGGRDVRVKIIDPALYGRMDGPAILKLALEE